MLLNITSELLIRSSLRHILDENALFILDDIAASLRLIKVLIPHWDEDYILSLRGTTRFPASCRLSIRNG